MYELGFTEEQMQASTRQRSPQSSHLSGLGITGRNVSFRRREVIYSAGDESDSIFLIKSGSVKLTVVSARGNEAVTAVLDAGDLVGPEALDVDPQPRLANAVALNNVRVTKVKRNVMLELAFSNPTICALLISSLINGIRLYHEELSDNLLYNSEQRLARTLLYLVGPTQNPKHQHRPALSQQELASMIGTTRQRVNVLLQRFKKMGFIGDSRGRNIHDSIRSVAGADPRPGGSSGMTRETKLQN